MVVRSVVALTVGIAALAGCSQAPQLSVSDAWVRLAAVPGRPAAGYFTLHGGPTDATLISVATDVAVRTEMHEMKAGAGGAMTMDAMQQLRVPATQTVRFAPGGKHLMLFDLNPSVKPGGKLTFTFTFADGVRIQQPASVIAAGDPAPKE
ncbi:copper chaperone PCu(A)C [Sphingomonas lycopersici]|uniref:copper chaperone PCu(A)C n=3 Tax=Sphingomonas TaxID=13687 RepID=UPI0015C77C98|nr:copper chaperone PCu(A)C [Sphingomonas lycopersici]